MKILCISLLRLGDALMQDAILHQLREKYPDAKIDVLVNSQFKGVGKILNAKVDEYWLFERDDIQSSLTQANYNILWGIDYIHNLTRTLSKENYDLVINLTGNKLSAFLMYLISSSSKVGLQYKDNSFLGNETRWQKYLNSAFSPHGRSVFHYIEVLARSLGLSISSSRKAQVESSNSNNLILLQCFSSDEKKNWGLVNYQHLFFRIKNELANYQLKVIASESEYHKLIDYFPKENIVVTDLEEARRLISQASVFISGDTGLKHLAANLNVPTVEINLGSADSIKTHAWDNVTEVLTPKVNCYPCVHSTPCKTADYRCRNEIPVDQVLLAIKRQILSDSRLRGFKSNSSLDFEKYVWSYFLSNSFMKNDFTYSEFKNLSADLICKSQKHLMDILDKSKWDSTYLLSTSAQEELRKFDLGFYFSKARQSLIYADKETYIKDLDEVEEILKIRELTIQREVNLGEESKRTHIET